SGGQSSMDEAMLRISGVDLTRIDGINTNTALKSIAEIGTDMSRWKTSKHFASWLGLCPGTKITGGKIISARTKKVVNRAAVAMRIAASTLLRSKSALGAYYRRQRSRLGAPKAITATAHKLAKLVCTMLKHGSSYYDAGQDIYEERYRSRVIASLKKRAQEFGLALLDVSGFQQGSGNPLSETGNLL
ncbi:transposase, partial [Desulforegula conservatrix]|uniref:transposase n=1 Tax=Desulforegula conservatrix TaxID=153026 RepID=UPI001E5AC60F